jgi:uncharacterized protein
MFRHLPGLPARALPPARALLLTCALLLTGAGAVQAQQAPLDDLDRFPKAELTLRSGTATHHFHIWVADTAAHEEQGLMFVRELPADQGMVFVEAAPKVWAMWMRNTYIELDMLWVGEDGRVLKIAEHARPHDETTLKYDGAAKAVIELPGGAASRLGIKLGDYASWQPVHSTEAH